MDGRNGSYSFSPKQYWMFPTSHANLDFVWTWSCLSLVKRSPVWGWTCVVSLKRVFIYSWLWVPGWLPNDSGSIYILFYFVNPHCPLFFFFLAQMKSHPRTLIYDMLLCQVELIDGKSAQWIWSQDLDLIPPAVEGWAAGHSHMTHSD